MEIYKSSRNPKKATSKQWRLGADEKGERDEYVTLVVHRPRYSPVPLQGLVWAPRVTAVRSRAMPGHRGEMSG